MTSPLSGAWLSSMDRAAVLLPQPLGAFQGKMDTRQAGGHRVQSRLPEMCPKSRGCSSQCVLPQLHTHSQALFLPAANFGVLWSCIPLWERAEKGTRGPRLQPGLLKNKIYQYSHFEGKENRDWSELICVNLFPSLTSPQQGWAEHPQTETLLPAPPLIK